MITGSHQQARPCGERGRSEDHHVAEEMISTSSVPPSPDPPGLDADEFGMVDPESFDDHAVRVGGTEDGR